MHHSKTSDDFILNTYRFRTKRQKKRLVHKDREKQLLRLDRESSRIYKQIQALGWEELEEPIQRGWKRTFVLREDIARSGNAAFYQEILDKINTVQYSRRKDFTVREWNKKTYTPIEQKTQKFKTSTVKKLGLTDKQLALFKTVGRNRRGQRRGHYVRFSEPWRFTLRVQPNIVTRRKAGSAQLDSELDEIESYLTRNNLRPAIIKLQNGNTYKPFRWNKKWEDPRWKNPLKNKPLHEILNAVEEDGL